MIRATARAVPRRVGAAWSGSALHVDTYQHAPPSMARFRHLNPFHYEPAWRLPVPGQPGLTSCSMEAVWQGLKIDDSMTDFAMFAVRPAKRPPDHKRTGNYDYAATRFRYGSDDVDLVTARLLIYLPAYLHLLDRLVPESVLDEILQTLRTGRQVICYDWDSNTDIADPRSSYSHSAIIAAWVNGRLEQDLVVLWRRCATARGLPTEGVLPLDRYWRMVVRP